MIFTVHEDQWGHTYFEIRDGKVFYCGLDRKEQTMSEHEVSIASVLEQYKNDTKGQVPQLLAELRRMSDDRN